MSKVISLHLISLALDFTLAQALCSSLTETRLLLGVENVDANRFHFLSSYNFNCLREIVLILFLLITKIRRKGTHWPSSV